jgi:hypothetical protein
VESKFYSDSRYEEENEKFNKPIGTPNTWWWCYAQINGKYVTTGRFRSEEELNAYALKNLPNYAWWAFPSSSKDINEVQRQWKAHVLEMNHDLGEATETISRKPANEQRKKADEGFF